MTIKLRPKDYYWAAFAGFLTGLFTIPVLTNSGFENKPVLVALPFVVAVCWVIGLWLGKVLANVWQLIFQLAKFAEVGFLNTAINFGLLNLLSITTGITQGAGAGWINVPGTIAAAANSYIWNKLWVFQKIDNKGFFVDVPKFAAVTIFSMIINSLILAFFTDLVSPMFGLTAGAWLNVGKVVATAGSFFINFIGYKFLVFVKKS
jgi:putative flippase GtrA